MASSTKIHAGDAAVGPTYPPGEGLKAEYKASLAAADDDHDSGLDGGLTPSVTVSTFPQDIAVRLPAGCQERGMIDEDRPFAEIASRSCRRGGGLGRAGGV